jgi:3-deoxy-manno-octulosonate cytidylyltransferase (CMP-KDO synthetase)
MVARVAERSGVTVVMTHNGHTSGTERVAEAASRPEFSGFEMVVNIQGDEPFITREGLEGAIQRVHQGDDIGTAAAALDPANVSDPARVKVVTDANGRALYFSRAVIPFRQNSSTSVDGLYWQHVGIYACTRAALSRWVGLPPAPAELAERLEQLRALHHGMTIGVARLGEPVPPGIDTPDDLRRAEAHWLALQR